MMSVTFSCNNEFVCVIAMFVALLLHCSSLPTFVKCFVRI
ncbi:unnamed protein product [Brassica rapa]|uniref:Uncharacterized protein n=1 Tax=Brassica campestris TaxID=3711 RepID=A0A8D9H9J9_BRACM|nr:unnamed protein product [Brassica rapa]